jgi:hypothetical protein
MTMGRQGRQVELNSAEKGVLEKELNRQNINKHYEYRIRMVLSCADSKENVTISKETGYSEITVSKWRNRWSLNYARLQAFSKGIDGQGISEVELRKEILAILGDAPRSGVPCKITLSQREQIQALACENPEDLGLPFTHWTHKELAKAVANKGILGSISASHIGRLLKKTH